MHFEFKTASATNMFMAACCLRDHDNLHSLLFLHPRNSILDFDELPEARSKPDEHEMMRFAILLRRCLHRHPGLRLSNPTCLSSRQ